MQRGRMMATTYEWSVEFCDGPEDEADILDSIFRDTYAEALADGQNDGRENWRIVLVRNVGDDLEGLTDRAWAYIRDGALPETFTYGADEDSGIRVPKRFHDEVKRAA